MKDLKPIFRYLYPCRREFILAILLLFVECGCEMVIPLLMSQIIDNGVATGDVALIWLQGGKMAACAALALAAGLTYARFAARAAYRFGAALR